jgi:hypothetical protein
VSAGSMTSLQVSRSLRAIYKLVTSRFVAEQGANTISNRRANLDYLQYLSTQFENV